MVSDGRRIGLDELETLRRSLGACGSLPRDQLERIVAELDRLLRERRDLELVVDRLRLPWADLRAVLNELNRLAAPDHPAPAPGDRAADASARRAAGRYRRRP